MVVGSYLPDLSPSFQNDNCDGVGDLKGIITRLNYLSWLGVSTIWISSIYPSPMADFRYDISDFTCIHSLFGSMEDFDELVHEAHQKGIKVILDLVQNHNSDQHPWFLESRSRCNNFKRDWYIWEDARPDGNLSNTWLSVLRIWLGVGREHGTILLPRSLKRNGLKGSSSKR